MILYLLKLFQSNQLADICDYHVKTLSTNIRLTYDIKKN